MVRAMQTPYCSLSCHKEFLQMNDPYEMEHQGGPSSLSEGTSLGKIPGRLHRALGSPNVQYSRRATSFFG